MLLDRVLAMGESGIVMKSAPASCISRLAFRIKSASVSAGDIGLVYAQNRIRILQIRQFRVSHPIPWERQRLIIGTEGAVKQ